MIDFWEMYILKKPKLRGLIRKTIIFYKEI